MLDRAVQPEVIDMFKALLEILILFASCAFLGSQIKICVTMPAEWFIGLVSGLVIVLCICFHQRE